MRWFPAGRGAKEALAFTVVRGDLVIVISERGELESSSSVEVKCEVEGQQTKIVTIVPEGTQVSKGQEVTRFDTESIQKALSEQEVKWKQAEGKSKASKSELEVARNKMSSEIDKGTLALKLAKLDHDMYANAEYAVEENKKAGALELARKNQKEAEDDIEFTRNLVKKGFSPLEAMRLKELGLQEKKYVVSSGEAELMLLKDYQKRRKLTELEGKSKEAEQELVRTHKSQEAAVEKAKDELEAASETATLEKLQVERLKQQRDRCVVLAPQDGIIVYYKRPWDDGSRIQPGAMIHYQQPIFTLPDLSKMRVKVKIHESVVKKIAAGLKATIQIEALPNQTLHGVVKKVGTLAQSEGWRSGGVKEYMTEIEVEDLPDNAGIRPGMSADVKVQVRTLRDVVLVPVQAVAELDGEHVCYVTRLGGADRRVVQVGESNEQFLEVKEGLQEGEAVALDARARANAEAKKAPQPGPKPPSES